MVFREFLLEGGGGRHCELRSRKRRVGAVAVSRSLLASEEESHCRSPARAASCWTQHPALLGHPATSTCCFQASCWSVGTDTAPGFVSKASPPPLPVLDIATITPAPPAATQESLHLPTGSCQRSLPAVTGTAPKGKVPMAKKTRTEFPFFLLLIL